ncbi:unnamed protein product [Rotaria socialis]|uniref:F-box domain-containing protein n=1 Tax=Rotaria socialis TaxID=392032 RepID=A0A817WE51_9BILA|nr:unnamed protein product [Rotaria socialis]
MDMNKRKFQETFNSTEYDVENQTKIMTHQDCTFLLTLPVELVHMIFDNLSDFTIICSFRQVCTRLNMIMDTYPPYQKLAAIRANTPPIDYGEVQHLINALKHNTALAKVILSGHCIGVDGAKRFADILRINKTIITLDLICAEINEEGAKHLAFPLLDNTTLTTLDLSSNAIRNSGAYHLACALRKNSTLTTLDLGHNDMQDEGAQYLADALRNNTTLTTLNLEINRIGNLGAQYLTGALQNNTRLMTLDLGLNDIRDEGVEHLIVALRENRTLTTLTLEWFYVEQNLKNRLNNLIKCNKKT